MAVLGLYSVAIEVPNLDEGVGFYSDAGLDAFHAGDRVHLRCRGQDRDSLLLVKTAGPKRLHHVCLRADDLPAIRASVEAAGGRAVSAPAGFDSAGLWVVDPHGIVFHLVEAAPDLPPDPDPPFTLNEPGRIVRIGRSAILPKKQYGPVKPRRLGHMILFTPDVFRSVEFVTRAFGMGLADRSQDFVAFCCAAKNSEHHVLAFAKSRGIGLHHVSFQVADPDEVGRGGRALADKTGHGEWGFGRHTIGSNFFHYIKDPWGSWFEYYSDMDYIADLSTWTPTNYDPEDSLANWGPSLPPDFLENRELGVHG